jgi:hypothetical protein
MAIPAGNGTTLSASNLYREALETGPAKRQA